VYAVRIQIDGAKAEEHVIAEPLRQGHDTHPCLPRTPLLPIILADDFLCSLPDGTLLDRKQFLEYTATPATISDLAVHDVNVRLMGDFAIIHARTTFGLTGGQQGEGRYTDVWARRSGSWLAVAAHVTRKQPG